MLSTAKEYINDIFNLFYPRVCVSCTGPLRNSEEVVCTKCESELPRTGYWNDPKNKIVQRLWGRVDVKGATALFQFQKGSGVQELLHQLKYKSRQDVGKYIGGLMAYELQQPGSIINKVDVIVPVPLHWKKLKKRGYNQCDPIAGGLSEVLGIPFTTTAVERAHENVSQTGKNRFDRWENVANIFSVIDAEQLKGKHVLVVDDVITTGATSEACMQTILSVPGTSVSFAAVAHALV